MAILAIEKLNATSHVPMLSDPKLVLDVIRKAAHAVQKSAAAQSV
jgi:hypothetical protein